MDVQRYDYNPYRQHIGKQFNGAYVTFADYAKLRALYEAACERIDAYEQFDKDLSDRDSDYRLSELKDAHDKLRKEAGL